MALSACTGYKCTAYTSGHGVFGKLSVKYGHGAVVVGHKCLVFSGHSDYNDATSRIFILDTNKVKWSYVRTTRESLAFGTSRIEFILEDVLTAYICTEPHKEYHMLQLDLVQMNEWTLVNDRNPPNIGGGTAGCFFEKRNEMIVFGGHDAETNVYRYNVSQQRWSLAKAAGTPPNPRSNHATCSSGDHMFVVGGSLHGSKRRTLDVHVLNVAHLPFKWSALECGPYQPPKRYLFKAAVLANRIIVYGGFNKTRDFCSYDIRKRRWLEGVRGKVERPEREIRFESISRLGTSYYAMAYTNDKLWIFGGCEMEQFTHLEIEPL